MWRSCSDVVVGDRHDGKEEEGTKRDVKHKKISTLPRTKDTPIWNETLCRIVPICNRLKDTPKNHKTPAS